MSTFYKLGEDGIPYPCNYTEEQDLTYSENRRGRTIYTKIVGDITVRTSFLSQPESGFSNSENSEESPILWVTEISAPCAEEVEAASCSGDIRDARKMHNSIIDQCNDFKITYNIYKNIDPYESQKGEYIIKGYFDGFFYIDDRNEMLASNIHSFSVGKFIVKILNKGGLKLLKKTLHDFGEIDFKL